MVFLWKSNAISYLIKISEYDSLIPDIKNETVTRKWISSKISKTHHPSKNWMEFFDTPTIIFFITQKVGVVNSIQGVDEPHDYRT